MKIALIVGHTERREGADSYNGHSEYSYNSEVAKLVQSKCRKDVRIFYRDGIGREGVARNIGAGEFDVSIELHFNSFDGTAHGCEALYFGGDEMSERLARLFTMKYSETFNVRNRGIIEIKDRLDRRYKNFCYLNNTNVKMKILVEPFFGENSLDYKAPKVYAGFLSSFIDLL